MSNIKFVKGNVVDALLKGEIDFLINQVNCQGKYESGVAKEIGERIPEAKEAYLEHVKFCKAYNRKPLNDVISKNGVIHIFGQEFYGRDGRRYTNYGSLAKGMALVYDVIKEYVDWHIDLRQPNCVIGIPDMIGCGLGGADREIVLELIEHLLSWAKEVRIYQLEGK